MQKKKKAKSIKNLEPITDTNKVAGYKVSVQNQSYFCVQTMNNWTLKLKMIPFKIA